MWKTILDLAAQYGPFPAGIIIGIYIKQLAYRQTLEYMKEERSAYKDEKKALLELVQSQQVRIDKLHENLHPKQQRRKA